MKMYRFERHVHLKNKENEKRMFFAEEILGVLHIGGRSFSHRKNVKTKFSFHPSSTAKMNFLQKVNKSKSIK